MSVAKRALNGWLLAPALVCSLAAACSDDEDDKLSVKTPDGSVSDAGLHGDGGGPIVSLDAGLSDGSTPNASDGGRITDKAIYTAISATGHDRFYAVTYDEAGNIYAVGQTSEATLAGTDFSFVLAKYSADGVLDPSFGNKGIAIKNVAPGGAAVELARGVVIQADGKIVIAGNAEHQVYAADAGVGPLAGDADIFLVRFHANGSIDESFGTKGVVQQSLGDGIVTQAAPLADGGVPNPVLSGADAMWSLGQHDGKLVIHSATRGVGANGLDGGVRTDTDFALARFSADGKLDTSFGGTGIVRTDFGNTPASVRAATILANGSIVGAGYSNNAVLGSSAVTNPVLYKVKADGTPDATFATTDAITTVGVWHDFARADAKGAEAYGATQQGTKLVTLGYGPTPNTSGNGSTDLIWLRFDENGLLDKTFGDKGIKFQDVAGFNDNGRGLITLPDNRLLGIGRGTPTPAAPTATPNDAPADGLISILTENGQPDESFGPKGVRLYDFGGAGDHLWGVAVSPNKKSVAVVGIQTQTGAGANDNAALVILDLP